jgi:hypothetical protein
VLARIGLVYSVPEPAFQNGLDSGPKNLPLRTDWIQNKNKTKNIIFLANLFQKCDFICLRPGNEIQEKESIFVQHIQAKTDHFFSQL